MKCIYVSIMVLSISIGIILYGVNLLNKQSALQYEYLKLLAERVETMEETLKPVYLLDEI